MTEISRATLTDAYLQGFFDASGTIGDPRLPANEAYAALLASLQNAGVDSSTHATYIKNAYMTGRRDTHPTGEA